MLKLFGASIVALCISVGLGPAFAGSMSLLGAGTPPTTISGVTLDPANKGADISLSNGNLTATNTQASNTDNSVRSTTSHSTGKFYFEVTVVADTRSLVGVGNASATLSNFVGSDANGIGWFDSIGAPFVNGGALGSQGSPFTTGDVVCIALDLTNGAIYQRVNAGTWNGIANPTANPATNTGGLSLSGSGVAAGPYFVMVSPANSATTLTVNFGASAFAQTPPAGFGNW